jgi:hypothetical protein
LCRQARIFNVLSGLQTNRFEELNNYSGVMTRHKCDDDGGDRIGKMGEQACGEQKGCG